MSQQISFQELQTLKAALEEMARRSEQGGHIRKWFQEDTPFSIENYPKHKAFFDAGAAHRERLFMAANQVGKSTAGGYEVSCHATGLYPDWWEGRHFDHPCDIWVAGDTNETTRNILQNKLLGYPESAIGTGMIPGDRIVQVRRKQGTSDAIDTVRVRHESGGESIIGFKSYDQGRRSFQGTVKDVIWLDEECPQDVYNECVVRTMNADPPRGGLVLVTFTPLQGLTEFIQRFMKEAHREFMAAEVRI